MKKLAIDFGTANTYLAVRNEDGSIGPLELTVGGSNFVGTESAVFYGKDGEIIIGRDAVQMYYTYTQKERDELGLRLETNFKPDVTTRADARKAAVDFLSTIVRMAESSRIGLPKDVVIGVPSAADDAFCTEIRAIAMEAGFQSVELMHEPLGALSYHIARQKAADLVRKVALVIDFGGGTCDFALLANGKVRNSWGDMALGGRLFDDLFYRWVCEQNPVVATMTDECRFTLRTEDCRIAKETASNRWLTNSGWRHEPETSLRPIGVQPGIALHDATWCEFECRARHYVPTADFIKQFGDLPCNRRGEQVDGENTIDLIGWLRAALVEGLDAAGMKPKDLGTVILAGGSSVWPFVYDLCGELFEAHGVPVLRADNVFAAIAEGMLRYDDVRSRSEECVKRLTAELPAFVRQVSDDMSREYAAPSTDAALGEEIFDNAVLPTLRQIRDEHKKCSMEGFRKRLEECLSNSGMQGRLTELVRERTHHVNEIASSAFADWLAERGGVLRSQLGLQNIDVKMPPVEFDLPLVRVLTYGIVGSLLLYFSVSSSILSGGAMAIPVVIAAAAAWALEKSLSEISVPSRAYGILDTWAFRGLLRRKVTSLMRANFAQSLKQAYESNRGRIEEEITKAARNTIEELEMIQCFEKCGAPIATCA